MHEIHLAPQVLFNLGPFSVTNSIFTTWIGILLVMVGVWFATKKLRAIPSGSQNLVEVIVEGLLDLVEQVFQDRRRALQFFPFIATFFIFVLSLNWLGLVPGVGSIFLEEGKESISLFRPANTDLNTTLAIALISVLGTQIAGITAIGLFKHLGHYINFRSPIDLFVGILHLIGEVAKVLSFSFRLFGNMFAGEVLLIVITFLVPYIAPLPFYGLELFVGLIQALVFTMLTMVFLAIATTDTHGHEAH